MRLKVVILMTVLIVVFLALVLNREKEIENIKPQSMAKHNKKQTAAKKEEIDEDVKSKNQQLKSQEKKEKLEDDFYHELSAQRYSDEPVVEMISLAWEMDGCKKHSYYDTRKNYFREFALNEKQQRALENKDAGCNEFIKNYPTISQSMNKIETKAMFFSLVASSPYAYLVQRGMGYKKMEQSEQREFNNEIATVLLKSKNAQLLLFFIEISSEETFFRGLLEIDEVLKSANTEYAHMIVEQAVVLMSCHFNNGISCKADSSAYMLKECIVEDAACGLDVETWFAQDFTVAHYRDVKNMVSYFSTL